MGDVFSHNGSAVLAMVGKDCVAIACDKRLGVSFQTVSLDWPKVFPMNERVFLGLAGLGTDIQTLEKQFKMRVNLYQLRENREMGPAAFSTMVASTLYEHRFSPYFVTPVIAGLTAEGKPFISSMDAIGAPVEAADFVVAGTANEYLYGVCESFWKPDMDKDELFEVCAQCLLAGENRDALSGWGSEVIIISRDGAVKRTLRSRQD